MLPAAALAVDPLTACSAVPAFHPQLLPVGPLARHTAPTAADFQGHRI
jgi:hypothetical protein